MHLQRKHARLRGFRFTFVSNIDRLLGVDELLQVIAFGDDHIESE